MNIKLAKGSDCTLIKIYIFVILLLTCVLLTGCTDAPGGNGDNNLKVEQRTVEQKSTEQKSTEQKTTEQKTTFSDIDETESVDMSSTWTADYLKSLENLETNWETPENLEED